MKFLSELSHDCWTVTLDEGLGVKFNSPPSLFLQFKISFDPSFYFKLRANKKTFKISSAHPSNCGKPFHTCLFFHFKIITFSTYKAYDLSIKEMPQLLCQYWLRFDTFVPAVNSRPGSLLPNSRPPKPVYICSVIWRPTQTDTRTRLKYI